MRYKSAVAFRTALEERLNAQARAGQDLQRLRKTAAFERLLARLQADAAGPWVLKGGFALQLRLGLQARTTRDLDFTVDPSVLSGSERPAKALEGALRRAGERDLGDFFSYRVSPAESLDVRTVGVQAYRFPMVARLAGKPFESFHVDVGVGDPQAAPPEELQASRLFEFAELPASRIRAVAPVQHFAEKMHALTRTWSDRENTRTRDLVDLMLLLEVGLPPPEVVRVAVEAIFVARAEHGVPRELANPPASWDAAYPALAVEVGLRQKTVAEGMTRLREYWKGLGWPEK